MRQGFTLVELSIVLVILGLLAGGILTGQNLIRAAELRSVTTEFQNYQTAAMTFRNKYFALPGDMRNATDFWGRTSGSCGAPTATGTETCNGDGNGELDHGSPGGFGEFFTFWQHLVNAGLIEGSYTGIAGAATSLDTTLGTNAPRSKVSNAGWSAYYIGSIGVSATTWYEGNYGNVFLIGEKSTSSFAGDPAFTPEEAWNIDVKIDDGKPGIGRLVTPEYQGAADGTGCADGAASASVVASTFSYELTNPSKACGFVFKNAF